MMREWIKLFEEDWDFGPAEPEELDPQAEADRLEDERLAAVYERERTITSKILHACYAAKIDSLAEKPVVYDEEDGRSAVVRVEGSVTLEQLLALQSLGTGFTISSNPNTGFGVNVEFTVAKELDPTPKLKRR